MCGFLGAIGLRSLPTPERSERLLASIRHRGPDSSGSKCDSQTGWWLGFQRLAIQDLSPRSDQPMRHENGTVMTFNGELYNYVELRTELERLGHQFTTGGDTEVVLRGYVQWGEGVFRRANGMFAVALVEEGAPGVMLVRDRFGEKPLFYGQDTSGAWWFGSDAGALHEAGVGARHLDNRAVQSFVLLNQAEPRSGSFFEGIRQVPAAGVVRLGPNAREASGSWFNLEAEVAASVEGDAPNPAAVREALVEAVRLRLRSDVEVGTSLSGGLDSGAIVSSIRAVDPTRRIHAFTASFPGSPLDEYDSAALVAERHDVDLHRVLPEREGFLRELPLLVRRQGAPFLTPSVYAQWCVMKAAEQAGVTVLLDGQGADETWGGYAKYRALSLLDRKGLGRIPASLRTGPSRRAVRAGLSRKTFGYLTPDRIRPLLLAGETFRRGRVLGPEFEGHLDDPIAGFPLARTALDRCVASDLTRTILPDLLRFADRNSMAFGREVRLPFLDPTVVGMGLACDWSADTAAGWSKHTLRRAMAGDLPDQVVWNRDKLAYEVPTDAWMRHDDLQQALRAAHAVLVDRGVLVRGASLSATKTLTLAEFIRQFGL